MRKRDVEILTTILQDWNKGISLSYLASKYNLTERTLRNDLRMINDYLKSLQMPNIVIRPEGTFEFDGEIDGRIVLKHLNNIDACAYHMQMNERDNIILAILIVRNDYVTTENLSEILFVSRSTIIKDINRLKCNCSERGLQIQSVLGLGITICSDETLCRKELFRIVKDNVTLEAKKGGIFQHILLKELQFDISLDRIERLVRQNEKKRHLHFSDEGYIWFSCYLFVVANRIKNRHYLDEAVMPAENTSEDIAVEIFQDIMQELCLPVTEHECSQIRKETQDWNLLLKNGFDKDYIALENCIAEFIHALSDGLQVNYFDDKSLFDFTVYFIEEVKEKNNAGKQESVVFPQIREKYPDEYRIVKKSSEVFQKSLGLTLSVQDIDYLTMHVVAAAERLNHFKNVIQILIVCPGNMATGQFLQAQIRRHFSYKIKAVCSLRDLYDDEWLEDVDMLISTIPVWNVRCPVVVVNPLLKLEDIQHIQEVAFPMLSKKNNKQHQDNNTWNVLDRIQMLLQQEKDLSLKNSMIYELERIEEKYNIMKSHRNSKLRELISPDTIEIIDHCDAWQNAVRRAGRMLVRKGKITSNYIDSCINNCEKNGPYFVLSDGLAIAHTHPEDGLIESAVSLLFIRDEVSFQHKAYGPVKLLFFICLKEPNNELLKFLIDCAQNKQLVAQIEKQTDSGSIYEILSNYEIQSESKGRSNDK